MEIKRVGSQPSAKGPSEWFTGIVRIDPLFQAPDPALVQGASVTFEPEVETTYDSDAPVNAFPGELRQVFSNLIMNAADALEKSGDRLRIHVFASRDWNNPSKTGLRITVSDNGCGIPPEKRAHLSEPFYTTKGSKGTGLGLWVSHGIVKKYGGTIRFRSTVRPDRCGTTFAVFLPISQP